jgi:hypothetical protein
MLQPNKILENHVVQSKVIQFRKICLLQKRRFKRNHHCLGQSQSQFKIPFTPQY